MRVKNKLSKREGFSSEYNVYSPFEIVVYYDNDNCDSDFISNFDVQLQDDSWKDMKKALDDHDIITDSHVTCFFFPENAEDKVRGYTLT